MVCAMRPATSAVMALRDCGRLMRDDQYVAPALGEERVRRWHSVSLSRPQRARAVARAPWTFHRTAPAKSRSRSLGR